MESVLDVTFVALAVLFAVWNVEALARYVHYKRLVPTAELTWLAKKPWFYDTCLGIGLFMITLTAFGVLVLDRPLMTTVSQGLMALYYTVMFPLSFQIRRGFYESGIWFERSFVPYEKVRRISWREKPELVLVATKDADLLGRGFARLQVPGDHYGETRRILAGHIEDRTLRVEKGILGLANDVPAQEQV